jgi:hypothetical protein
MFSIYKTSEGPWGTGTPERGSSYEPVPGNSIVVSRFFGLAKCGVQFAMALTKPYSICMQHRLIS